MPVHRSLAALVLALISFASISSQPEAQALGENDRPTGPLANMTPSAPGDELWVNRSSRGDYPTALVASPDGSSVFVTGYGTGPTTFSDYVTEAYDSATGAQLWSRRYNGPREDYAYANAMGVSPDGSKVFVTGSTLDSLTNSGGYVTLAYDAGTGATLWRRRYISAENEYDSPSALGVSPDGSMVFVTGECQGMTGGSDFATLAYNAATGGTLWGRRYNGQANSTDYAAALGVSPDGAALFVTGRSEGSGSNSDYATLAYDAASGATLWSRRYNGPSNSADYPDALGISSDGSKVFVAGDSEGPTGDSDYATVAYDAATGMTLWEPHSYNGPGHGDDAAFDFGMSPDGSMVFVTGYGTGASGHDFITLAYDASTGTIVWSRRYNGPANLHDVAQALGVSPDGSTVFVTGSSGSDYNYATLAYDAVTGATLWERSYNGPGNLGDTPYALGVSPDGSKVFVSGSSHGGSPTFEDYATVAYSTS